MDTLEQLIEIFKKFPGIGPRQARRFAYHLLHEANESNHQLANLIKNLKTGIHTCELCQRFFAQKYDSQKMCHICLDEHRDRSILMILTQDTDINAIEQRRMYNGLYFVIGKNAELSTTDPLSLPRLAILKNQMLNTETNTENDAEKPDGKIDEKTDRPQTNQRDEIKEIILAMNANTEGEHTAEIIKSFLKKTVLVQPPYEKVRITILGRGLSTGTELEYSDTDTLKSALDNRRII